MVLTFHKSAARCFVLCLALTAAAQLANAQQSSILSPIHLSLTKSEASVAQVAEVSSGDMAFPAPLQPGTDQILYLHLVGDTTRFGESRSNAATILPSPEWIRQQPNLLFWQGVYAGIIVGLALYNLMLFLSIRERVYLFYVIYVLAVGAFWIACTGFFSQYLWPSHPLLDRHAQPALAAVVIVFSIFFVRRFLAVPEHSRNVDRVLLGVAAFTVVLYLASLAGLHFALAPVLASIGVVVTVVYAGMGLAAARRGYCPARFFLIAFAALLTGNVLYLLMFLRVPPTTFLTYNAAQAGPAIECILLAFALADLDVKDTVTCSIGITALLWLTTRSIAPRTQGAIAGEVIVRMRAASQGDPESRRRRYTTAPGRAPRGGVCTGPYRNRRRNTCERFSSLVGEERQHFLALQVPDVVESLPRLNRLYPSVFF